MNRAEDTAPLKPPLKWAGGKRWLVPLLRKLYAPFARRRLVEPFCGGLSVALGLLPGRALLNDINPHSVNFYRHLQGGLRMELPMRNDRDCYDRHRAEFNRLIGSGHGGQKRAAELFYYLNRTGYNGLCRFNSRGEFNVPFGRYASLRYRDDLGAYREVLADWQFENVDFGSLKPGPNDFVYADPPYDVQFRQYSSSAFGWPEQERLANWLARRRGPLVVSNQATARILELYGDLGFRLFTLEAPRMISCNGDRTPASEMLALLNLEPDAGTVDQIKAAAKRRRT